MALIVFTLAAGWLLYLFLGYPLLLGCLAWRRGRPVRRQTGYSPGVSMIVAVRNGEHQIERKLASIFMLDYPAEKLEVLIVSNGSTDGTEQKVEAAIGTYGPRLRLLREPAGGKCGALNCGMAAAAHELLVFTDVRQELARNSLALLMENFADPTVGAASAELVIRQGDSQEEVAVGLYWRYELWIRRQLSKLDSIFGATGAYYALRRELAVPLPADALLDDMHLPLAAFFRGYRLILDSRAQMYDEPSRLEDEFWRKVRTLAGNYQIIRSYPGLLGPANRLWPHYVSYKFGRLLAPFALLTILAASFFLPAGWRAAVLLAQGAFYGLALLDYWLPEGLLVKRVSSPARAFVILMSAAACATSIFFVPGGRLWRTTRVEASSTR